MDKGGRPSLPKIESPDDLDDLDLEIIAALEVDPKTPCRIIAERTGKGITTIWDRIQRIRKSDWVEQMRDDLKSLGGLSLEAVGGGLQFGMPNERASVAMRLLSGLGVLTDKHENVNRNIPATANEFLDSFERMSTEDQDRVIAGLATRSDADGKGGAGQSDSSVVAGNSPSPDA